MYLERLQPLSESGRPMTTAAHPVSPTPLLPAQWPGCWQGLDRRNGQPNRDTRAVLIVGGNILPGGRAGYTHPTTGPALVAQTPRLAAALHYLFLGISSG